MSKEQLIRVAGRELRDVDQRFQFWVALAVETAPGSGASAADVDWEAFDWPTAREALDSWLDGLALDTPEVYCQWPVAENVRLRFIAKPRRRGQGYRRLPSFNLAAPPPLPPLQFDDGTAGQLEDLEIGIVQQLASGHRRLAIEQVSHREVWKTVAESMIAAGCISTSELDALEREVHAMMLGLVDDPDGKLGAFDDDWRAINRLDPPTLDDPRAEGG